MKLTRTAFALLLATILPLSACGGDGGGDGSGGIIRANGTEPANPLVPTATTETGGGKIVDQLFAGLVAYKKDGSIVNEVAKSITSDDNVVWKVKLDSGWKFSDGTPVTASAFVDAWNYGALSTNNQLNSYFFYPIAGFDAVQAEKPKVKTLSGLEVVSDNEFRITLAQPEREFPLRLGYSAFFPLPKVAFNDLKAFGENPIGNGPYKLAKKGAWRHAEGITLVPNKTYDGYRKPRNDGLEFKFYLSIDTAYTDVQSGNLDLLDQVPSSAFGTFRDDDALKAYHEAGSVFESFTFPDDMKHFGRDEEGLLRRAAVSMAIDRSQITEKIFRGTRQPAADFSSPLMPGFTSDLKGSDVLDLDAVQAKSLWKQADAISPWTGTFELAYNSDGPNKAWVEAVVNQIETNLGIEAEGHPYPTFDEFRELIVERKITSAFSTGWQPDYPSTFNYLQPIYQTGAGGNDGDYSSKLFDDTITRAAAAESDEERYALQQEAQEVLLGDLPAIPLWNQSISGVSAKDVEGVSFNWQNAPEYYLAVKD